MFNAKTKSVQADVSDLHETLDKDIHALPFFINGLKQSKPDVKICDPMCGKGNC